MARTATLERKKILALLVVALMLLVACGEASGPPDGPAAAGADGEAEPEADADGGAAEETKMGSAELTPVTLRLNHLPWGMHVPYFVALERGFYEEEGLDMTIEPGSGAQEAINLVGAGREDFGIAVSDTFITARESQNVPIVTIAMDQQRNPFGIFSLKETGIEEPADLEGKTLAQPPASTFKFITEVAIERAGVDLDSVNMTDAPAGSEIQLMLAGNIDASVGFVTGQPLTLAEDGYEANVLPLSDFGLNMYGTLLFTNETMLAENPDLVEAFLRATLRGSLWAHDNMAEATQLMLLHRPDRGMLEMEKLRIIFEDYYVTDELEEAGYWGAMTDESWQEATSILLDAGVIDEEPAVDELYTNEFVEDMDEAHQFLDKLVNEEPHGMEYDEDEAPEPEDEEDES